MGGPNLILLILLILTYPNLSHLSQWSKFPDADPPEGRVSPPSDSFDVDYDFSVELASRSESSPGPDAGSASDSDDSFRGGPTLVTPSSTPPPSRPANDWVLPPTAPHSRPIRLPTTTTSDDPNA